MSAEATAVQTTPVLMPKIGQAMAEGTVLQWHYKDGERVEKSAILVTIETDKATYELEAPATGILHIYVGEGQEVAVGTVIGEIGDAARKAQTAPATVAPAAPAVSDVAKVSARKKVLASPKAKQLAAEHGIDLSTITPSGADGIISAGDVEQAIAARKAAPPPAPLVDTVPSRTVRERRKLTGILKTSARRVREAWQTIPHIVQMVDVDASALLATRTALKVEIPSLTLNDLILHTAARILAEQPALNGTVEDDTLVLYEGVDIGFAVDTPRGLVVPVIRHVDQRSVAELAAESQRLIDAARSGRLGPNDIGGASLTVSNLGMFGIRAGTPVINLGESILVFVGAVEDRPVVREGQIVIRPALTLSIAYDHRVADGVTAAQFTRGLQGKLESLESGESPESRVRSLESTGKDASPLAGDLDRREVRTISQGGRYAVRVHSRDHAWILDEPGAAGGTDTGPDPVTAFLGALLSCMTISFKAAARRRNVTIERVNGRVRATPEGHVKNIDLTLEVWSPDPEENVRALLDRAKRGCYVSGVLRPEIEVSITLITHTA